MLGKRRKQQLKQLGTSALKEVVDIENVVSLARHIAGVDNDNIWASDLNKNLNTIFINKTQYSKYSLKQLEAKILENIPAKKVLSISPEKPGR